MGWNTVGKVSDFPEGRPKGVIVEDRPIMISKLDGRLYAIDAICPHKFGYVPMGRLNGDSVVCPAHFAEFDLRTGKLAKDFVSLKAPDHLKTPDLRSYELRIEGEEIRIMI